MSLGRFRELSEPFIEKAGITVSDEAYLLSVLEIVKEKIKLFKDVPDWIGYFFREDFPLDPESVEKTLNKSGAIDRLSRLREQFAGVEDWRATALESALKQLATEIGCKTGELVHPARVAVSGRSIGPSLYEMLEIMGKSRVLQRMDRVLQKYVQG
jgi:glutamyl/glutaminyl-tRNA synthetase